ncbi:MAG: thymidylate synthase [Opitutaceae bacterium]|nr:thymidylate synthase [Opitutaceae bacterium]
MFKLFSGTGADDTWLKIVETLRHDADVCEQPGRGGPTKEILHAAISIANPRARWVISRAPAINPAYAFAELIWTLSGREDSAFLTYFNSKLPELAGDGPTFHGSYGKRLRRHLGFDQFARAYHALKHCPDSRQVVLQIWDGKIDLPGNDGLPVSPDIPCNLVALLKIRGGRLEWTQVMRSNDIFRGIPYDFVQFTCLQEIFAGWLGVELGSYCHVSDSLHAYVRDLPKILTASPTEAAVDSANLRLSFDDSKDVFADIERAVERIVTIGSSSDELLAALHGSALPLAYKDMLAVLTAEGLRLRRKGDAYREAIAACVNPLYRQLWLRWLERYAVKPGA